MSKSTVAEPTKSAQPAEAEPDAQATADASKEPSTPGALFHTRFSETFTSVIKSRAIRNSPDTAKLWRGVETLGGRLRADTHPIFEFHLAMSQVDMVKHLSDIHTTLINSTLTHLRAWIVVAAPQGNESKETIERFAAFRVGLSEAAGSVFTAQQWCDFAGGVATTSLTPELLGDFTDSPPDAKRKRTE